MFGGIGTVAFMIVVGEAVLCRGYFGRPWCFLLLPGEGNGSSCPVERTAIE